MTDYLAGCLERLLGALGVGAALLAFALLLAIVLAPRDKP